MSNLTEAQAVLALLLLIAGPGGAAWVAVRLGLNGARQDIRDIKNSAGRMEDRLGKTSEGVARLEERTGDHERRIARLEDAA